METDKVRPKCFGTYTRYGMFWYWDKAEYGKKDYRSVARLSDRCVVYEVRYVRKRFLGRCDEHWIATVDYMLINDYGTCRSAMEACRDHLLKVRLEG